MRLTASSKWVSASYGCQEAALYFVSTAPIGSACRHVKNPCENSNDKAEKQTNTMLEIYDEHEEKDIPPAPCETCEGTGEVGPFGWEYPEYDTCPDCKGSGLERDHLDPDLGRERKRDDTL